MKAFNLFQTKIESISANKYWLGLTTLFCVLIVLIFSSPRYNEIVNKGLLPNKYSEKDAWYIFDHQRKNPLDFTIFNGLHPASHEAKMVFRLTMPFFAYVLHLNCPQTYLLQVLFGVGIFVFAGLIVLRDTQSKYFAVLIMFCIALLYAGKLSFVQFGGHFDGTSLFFLLLAIYTRHPLIAFMALMFGFYNDERTVLSSGFVLVYYVISSQKHNIFTFFVAGALYVITRLFLTYYFDISTPLGKDTGVNEWVFNTNLGNLNFQMLFLKSLEGLWVVVFIFVFSVKNRWVQALSILTIVVVSLAAGFVWDVQRSYAFMLPLVFPAIYYVSKHHQANEVKKWLEIALLVCFIVPSNPVAYFIHDVGPANSIFYEIFMLIKAK